MSVSQEHVKILVVDDDLLSQMLITAMLSKIGYRSDVASNGLEALRMLSERQYDLVLMDCQMPVMDGYTAARCITNKESNHLSLNQKVTIIALTADSTDHARSVCKDVGMHDFITKPVRMQHLEEIVKRWL
jgi:CheY-like chemotaxis protein